VNRWSLLTEVMTIADEIDSQLSQAMTSYVAESNMVGLGQEALAGVMRRISVLLLVLIGQMNILAPPVRPDAVLKPGKRGLFGLASRQETAEVFEGGQREIARPGADAGAAVGLYKVRRTYSSHPSRSPSLCHGRHVLPLWGAAFGGQAGGKQHCVSVSLFPL
jgi:hypothetical protein